MQTRTATSKKTLANIRLQSVIYSRKPARYAECSHVTRYPNGHPGALATLPRRAFSTMTEMEGWLEREFNPFLRFLMNPDGTLL